MSRLIICWCCKSKFMLRMNLKNCQTYIEPTIDMWTREKRLNNIVVNDPKGGVPRSMMKNHSIAA